MVERIDSITIEVVKPTIPFTEHQRDMAAYNRALKKYYSTKK